MHKENLAQTQPMAGTQCMEGFCSSMVSSQQLSYSYTRPAAQEAEWPLGIETKATLKEKEKIVLSAFPWGSLIRVGHCLPRVLLLGN